jgi:cytoskeletal protein CcmA (bactofilin family)
MFKKSEEQEWTRFRGALSKDRDETGAASIVPESSEIPANSMAASGAAQATAGPSFRSSASDVNVGLPTSRSISRSASDGVEIESLIGERSNFEGTLKTEGPVRLLGSIQGEIESKSTIYVEEKAHVTARLTGAHVTVAGQVDGQIFCEGRVEIRPTGRVTGEINAGALIVQEGAYFEGNSRMASGGHPPGAGGASSSSGAAAAPGGSASASSGSSPGSSSPATSPRGVAAEPTPRGSG